MKEMLKEYMQRIRGGKRLDFEQALLLANRVEAAQLFEAADQLRREFHNDNLDLCSIVNAKSGKCSEDCKFCAQSSWYPTEADSYDLVDKRTVVEMAKENEAHGVKRLSLVTAGKTVTDEQIGRLGELYGEVAEECSLSFCASMGMMTKEKAEKLKSYGVSRYHCNLEACRRFFPNVCTTHSYDEKVTSIRAAQEAGLDVCSGGIIGMGETLEHRIELAIELRDLDILSIPLNILTPIPNTPFANVPPLTLSEVLTCVAIFRFVNPRAVIRLAGGRGTLGEQQYKCFTSGANGAIVGNYLTTAGNNLTQDVAMFRKLGYRIDRA